MENFEFIEHTADVGIRVYGKTLEDLFKNAARAIFKLIVDFKPTNQEKETILLEAETLDELFVTWLNELISIFFSCQFLPAEYNILIEEMDNKQTLKANILGQNFNPYENKINMEIKAATYHNLKIEKKDGGFVAEVILDV